MAVDSTVLDQDSYRISVPDQGATVPVCEPKHFISNVLEVSQPLKDSPSLDAVLSGQNKVNQNMQNKDVYYPCIADGDLEKGNLEKCRTKNEPNGNVKVEIPLMKTMQSQISIQMGETIMQMLEDNSLVLPKFSFRDKTVPERVHDTLNNRPRKYKRSASFNSRKVVLLFSVLSSLGTMILIFLTLRVRQIADGSLHG